MITKQVRLALIVLLVLGGIQWCFAQTSKSKAVEPTATPQEINESTTKTKETSHTTTAPKPSSETEVLVKEGETVNGFTVLEGKATIRGKVKGDIHAKESKIVIENKGSVEGSLYLEDSTVENHSASAIRVKGTQEAATAPAVADIARIEYSKEEATPPAPRTSWLVQQFSLALLLVICAGVFAYTAPVATHKVAEEVSAEPVRCLIMGAIAAIALSMVSVLNANLLHFSPHLISLAWSPFGFGLAVLMLGIVAFGWVCGLHHIGNYVANKIGHTDEGTLFGRTLLGAGTLLLFSIVLSGIFSPLAAFALLLQGLVTVLGIGATLITGFGRETNWLGNCLSRRSLF